MPKVIEFMDALPVSSAGNILKKELQESLGNKLA
jgi:acyl-CoA synthetase (AMP-forming)/AMP-acid ligase II